MSSDGATDKPRSSRPVRGEDRGVAGIALAVLLVLALVATVVMIFSDNAVWMRIGTLAALWAAFIGAFLVARYRRQAASEAARVRDLHTVYELQLEREISARREHELVVEKDLRDNIRVETSDSLHALRQEIAALREQLGQLGVSLPEDRFAVSGHASAGELGAASTLPSVPSERVAPRRRAAESTASTTSTASTASTAPTTSTGSDASAEPAARAASGDGLVGTVGTVGSDAGATGVRREETPSTERTEKFSPVDAQSDWAQETYREQQSGPAVRPATRPRPVADAEKAPTQETPEPAATSRHGEGGGLSVAELMARLGGDGGEAPTGGRRRRRAED